MRQPTRRLAILAALACALTACTNPVAPSATQSGDHSRLTGYQGSVESRAPIKGAVSTTCTGYQGSVTC